MKTFIKHIPIPEDSKSSSESTKSRAENFFEPISPLAVGLAAVSECSSPGVDLDIYLMAIEAGRSHQDALIIAKLAPLGGTSWPF